jgi:hypothetical protein
MKTALVLTLVNGAEHRVKVADDTKPEDVADALANHTGDYKDGWAKIGKDTRVNLNMVVSIKVVKGSKDERSVGFA